MAIVGFVLLMTGLIYLAPPPGKRRSRRNANDWKRLGL
jgi:hypothetical protein